jgi:hypothetical protein
MALQFIPSPFPFNAANLEDLKGWEGLTPDGKRVRVFVHGENYVLQFPDNKPINGEGEAKPLQFAISKDGAFVLTSLLCLMQGTAIEGDDGQPLYHPKKETPNDQAT